MRSFSDLPVHDLKSPSKSLSRSGDPWAFITPECAGKLLVESLTPCSDEPAKGNFAAVTPQLLALSRRPGLKI